MTDVDYTRLDTDELIRRFADGAQRVGMGLDMAEKLPLRSPEAIATRTEIRAIAEILRARQPLAALRELYNHPTWEVRHWAYGQLGSLDPEWAEAGVAGIGEGLTATEVMALRAHARKKPARRPNLQERSLDALVARFEDATLREYAAGNFFTDSRGGPDIEFRNRIVREVIGIWNELRARDAVAVLLPFLDHENITVRCSAAIYCLPIATERALAVLEPIARKHHLGPDSWSASHALSRWRDEHPPRAEMGADHPENEVLK